MHSLLHSTRVEYAVCATSLRTENLRVRMTTGLAVCATNLRTENLRVRTSARYTGSTHSSAPRADSELKKGGHK